MPASIHEHPEEWLATALADGLTAEERRALDTHLAGCERCRTLQAEYAALDAFLRHELPVAIGPRPGFEARLVAGFRRRANRPAPWTRLGELAAWVLRQRGGQVAVIAAVLVGLVSLGQLLTSGGSRPPGIRGVAQREVPIELDLADKSTDRQAEPTFASSKDQVSSSLVPQVASQPVGDVEVGRDGVASSFGMALPAKKEDRSANEAVRRPESRSSGTSGPVAAADPLGLRHAEAGAFTESVVTGGNTTTAGGLIAGNSKSIAPLTLLNGRRVEDVQDQRYAAVTDTKGETIPGTPMPSTIGGESPTATTPAPPDVRKLIRNARAELEVAAFDAAVDAISAAAGRDGGFLDTRNSARGGNGKVSGTLVVKVLPENLDRFLAGLRSLGDLKNQTIQTEDVTKDYYDTDARLRNARRMEDRLLKMLDEVKGKMSEVLQVEKELARVRADIETMQGQLKLYDAQVRYATVTLSIYEKDLRRPAAFLLRETATLSLLAADVEKTAAEARRIADAARAQTVRSETTRDPAGRSRATLRLLIAPEAADGVIAQIKALGRVENFHLQDERVAQNGAAESTSAQDPARVERAPVTLELTVSHDEQVSRQVSFAVVATDVDGAFEKARAAASAAGGEVVSSNVSRGAAGHVTATVGVRVPAAGEAALVTAWRALGRAGEAETRRLGNDSGTDGGPSLITLTLTDAEPVVQQTTVRVLVDDAERRATEIKREAVAGHATVEASDFSGGSDGRQQAGLRFRLAMKDYPTFVERVRALGAVKDFTVQRRDRPERGDGSEAADGATPVSVELTLYREGRVVGESAGWAATWRQTFGQGAGALTWSVRMIGVALAFLAPWAALVGTAVLIARWWARRRVTIKPPEGGQS